MLQRLVVSLAVLAGVMGVSSFISPATVSAQGANVEACSRSVLGFPTWFRYLELDSNCEVVGPRNIGGFDWPKAAGFVAVAVLEILLRIGALVAVGYVIYGGFKFITSQGEPENAKNARNTIINAIIGLVITIASSSIVAFVANRLTS